MASSAFELVNNASRHAGEVVPVVRSAFAFSLTRLCIGLRFCAGMAMVGESAGAVAPPDGGCLDTQGRRFRPPYMPLPEHRQAVAVKAQVYRGEVGTQPGIVFLQAPVTDLVETEDTLEDAERMFHLGPMLLLLRFFFFCNSSKLCLEHRRKGARRDEIARGLPRRDTKGFRCDPSAEDAL